MPRYRVVAAAGAFARGRAYDDSGDSVAGVVARLRGYRGTPQKWGLIR